MIMVAREGYVVSDLHLGAGIVDPALEDFRSDELLARFIRRIARKDVTLIVAGDFIDFVQIPPFELAPVEHLLWDAAASVAKLEAARQAHPMVFDAMAEFLAAGGALWYEIGNHDLDAGQPEVQARLREVLGAGDLSFHLDHAVYHGVHVEHGHMFTPENAPRHATQFIHTWPAGDPAGKRYVERVWGTEFMLRFYNALERKYPFADSVKPTLALFYHGIKKGWVGAREVVRFVMFLKRAGVPLRGIASAVLAPDEVGLPEVVASMAEDPWIELLDQREAIDPGFADDVARVIADLPPEQRALIGKNEPVALGMSDPSLVEPRAATLGVFREDRELRAARQWLEQDGVTHVIFGHTHHMVDGALDGRLFNTGTWLPYLDLHNPDIKARIKAHGITLDMLADASLYRTDPWVAHIVPEPPGHSRVQLIRADQI
jgi:UDP-2,3-diacylglucosamine pyrophosphatase LpxH